MTTTTTTMKQTEVPEWINTNQDEYLSLMSGQPKQVAWGIIATLVATIIRSGTEDKAEALDALKRTFNAAASVIDSYDTNGMETIHYYISTGKVGQQCPISNL